MAAQVIIMMMMLSACSPVPGVSLSPSAYCTGRIDAEIALGTRLLEGWSARVAEVLDNCAPMLRVTIDSYTGE